jgi:hypothetical protein
VVLFIGQRAGGLLLIDGARADRIKGSRGRTMTLEKFETEEEKRRESYY